MRRKNVCLAWLALHFSLIAAIAIRQLCWLIANGLTLIPFSPREIASPAFKARSTISEPGKVGSNPAKQALVGYLHCAGIEGAYGFFAPNVPENFKLAFEFRKADGSVESDLPSVESGGAELRLGSLLDQIGRSRSELFQRVLIRMITSAAWQNHPDAVSARAVFGRLKLPGPLEFERGVQPSYEFIVAYDFERSLNSNPK